MPYVCLEIEVSTKTKYVYFGCYLISFLSGFKINRFSLARFNNLLSCYSFIVAVVITEVKVCHLMITVFSQTSCITQNKVFKTLHTVGIYCCRSSYNSNIFSPDDDRYLKKNGMRINL